MQDEKNVWSISGVVRTILVYVAVGVIASCVAGIACYRHGYSKGYDNSAEYWRCELVVRGYAKWGNDEYGGAAFEWNDLGQAPKGSK